MAIGKTNDPYSVGLEYIINRSIGTTTINGKGAEMKFDIAPGITISTILMMTPEELSKTYGMKTKHCTPGVRLKVRGANYILRMIIQNNWILEKEETLFRQDMINCISNAKEAINSFRKETLEHTSVFQLATLGYNTPKKLWNNLSNLELYFIYHALVTYLNYEKVLERHIAKAQKALATYAY